MFAFLLVIIATCLAILMQSLCSRIEFIWAYLGMVWRPRPFLILGISRPSPLPPVWASPQAAPGPPAAAYLHFLFDLC